MKGEKIIKKISVTREGLRFSEQDESPHPTTAVKRGADGVYRRNQEKKKARLLAAEVAF